MSEQQSSFEGWAKVEVMGHQSHIGFVRTEAYGGAVLFRIDSPGAPEREYTLESPEYAESAPDLRSWCPKGTVVKRKARPPVTVLVGAGSIYRIIPCTEAVALRAIEQEQRAELMIVKLPDNVALPAPESKDYTCCGGTPESEHADGCNFGLMEDEDEGKDEICDDCGRPMERCNC